MFDLQNQIGVKSYSFREIKKNAACAEAVLACSSKVVDLSGTHVNYDDPGSWNAVIAAYRDRGIAFAGIGVVQAKPDDLWNRRFFEFARVSGSKLVTVTFPIDDWEATVKSLEKCSEEYDIPVAIHNHGGYDWLGNTTVLDYVFRHSSKRLGLCLDTAWCLHIEQESPVEWMAKFGERVYGFHFKDFLWERNGKHQDCIVGTGALQLKETVAKFKELPAVRSAVLEYEGPDPVRCTAESIANIRAIL